MWEDGKAMVNIPTTEPAELIAGDTIEWKRSLSDYKASAGWTLKYALRGASNINLISTASGDDHLINILAATSANYTAGTYAWAAYVEKGSERRTIDKGHLEIKADLSTATTYIDRLRQLEADIVAINQFLGSNYKYSSYSIAGRSMSSHSITDLFLLRNNMQKELIKLRNQEALSRGKASSNKIYVRFGNGA